MAVTMNPQSMVILAMVPLIIWRLRARMKRLIGRQLSKAWRHWAAVIFFPIVIIGVTMAASREATALASLALGLIAGTSLAIFGLRLTHFEKTSEGMFYTPNSMIGMGLMVLFVGRMLFRFIDMAMAGGVPRAGANADFVLNPVTLVVFGLVFAYYLTYAAGLLCWRSGKLSFGTHA
jgi:hypothetical protein